MVESCAIPNNSRDVEQGEDEVKRKNADKNVKEQERQDEKGKYTYVML